jgi:hypothetical protein
MKLPIRPHWSLSLLIVAGAIHAGPAILQADGVTGVTAVSAKVSDDYVRTKLPEGGFQAETYVFGEGGKWAGQLSDETIDKIRFRDVAHVIAGPLAGQNYVPARDPAKTKLLIMVYWGTTANPDKPEENPLYYNYEQSLEEYRILLAEGNADEADAVLTSGLHQLAIADRQIDRMDFKNAAILGYDSSGLIGTEYGRYISHTALGVPQRDQVQEIEENRYFVVLMAYDFQMLWKQKKHKELWETRFSVSERHNAFDKALPVMARYAAPYFGSPTRGLVRERIPEGSVTFKDPTLIEFLTSPKD